MRTERSTRVPLVLLATAVSLYSQSAPVTQWIQAEDFTAISPGVGFVEAPPFDAMEPRNRIYDCAAGDWARYDSVSFLDGEFDSIVVFHWISGDGWPYSGWQVVVRIDAVDGSVIARVPLDRNYGFDGVSDPVTAPLLQSVTGVHSVFLTFEGRPEGMTSVDKLCFTGSIVADVSEARDYFVAPYGDNGNDGLSVEHPFRTIGHAAGVMKPGSRCFVRQGIYRETVRPVYTGVAGAPLSFSAYNGEDVYVSGADLVTGWSQHAGSIYRAPLNWSMGEYRNQILVDGEMAYAARCPDINEAFTPDPWWDYWEVCDYSPWYGQIHPVMLPTRVLISRDLGYQGEGYQLFTDRAQGHIPLPACLENAPSGFFDGALITQQGDWWADIGIIGSSAPVNATRTIYQCIPTSSWRALRDSPGFISHSMNLLSSPGEWYLRDSVLYLWAPDGGDPSDYLVEAKRRTAGFDLAGKQYVNLTGLKFIATSLTLEDATNCVVDRCHFKFVSHFDAFEWYEDGANHWNTPLDPSSGYKGVYLSGEYNTIRNSSIQVSAGSGVQMYGRHNTVTNCRIHDCNYTVTYDAAVFFGKRNVDDPLESHSNSVTHNTLHDCGRSLVNFDKSGSAVVEYNDLGRCGWLSNETASIYNFAGGAKGVEVANNWFHGCGGELTGYLYLDNSDGCDWTIHHNVFWQGPSVNGKQVIRNYEMRVGSRGFNNTVVDVGRLAWMDSMATGANDLNCWGDTAFWMFTDPDRRAYALRDGSPAIDAGEVIPDYQASYQGDAPDLGAYEWGETPWVAGADWEETPWSYPPTAASAPVGLNGSRVSQSLSLRVRRVPGALIIDGLRGTPARIRLYGMQGSLIRSHRVASRAHAATVSTVGLPKAMYLVEILVAHTVHCRRMVLR